MACYRLLILFIDIIRWRVLLNRDMAGSLFLSCLWLMPLCTRFRQSLKLLLFNSFRMSEITPLSVHPNCSLMASKGVLSSQAISMILSISFCSMLYALLVWSISDVLGEPEHQTTGQEKWFDGMTNIFRIIQLYRCTVWLIECNDSEREAGQCASAEGE